MPFNINDFISKITKDGARPNLFEVSIPNMLGETFHFRAQATSIPSSRIGVASTYYFGREAKFAGNRVFDNWSIEVLVDEDDYKISNPRGTFEKWMNSMNQHIGNSRDSGYVEPAGYMRDGMIKHYSKDGASIIAQYKMTGAFPVSVSPIGLSWNANDSIETFTVELALQWWERADVSGITT